MNAAIGPIAGVTISTPDLAAAEAVYAAHLGYRALGYGTVSAEQARLWRTPGAEGRRMLQMAPAAADDFKFRFIEMPAQPGYRAFSRHGWNAAELIVDKVDPLAERLATSPFEIVAPPMDLSFCPDIRAMQVRGPGGEILYLTEFKQPVPGLDSPPARCAVDRTFIVIAGGASLEAMQDFYAARFNVARTPVLESRVQTMALEFGLSREHRFRIAALPLGGRCYIEADEMPAAALPLPAEQHELPPGIAIVSFLGATQAGATGISCVRGAAGELLEIIPH